MDAIEDSSDGELFVEEHFAMVPEWLLGASISDCAVRLYAVLLRYGQTSGVRMPGRKALATRLHKKSTDTVDRAMRELVLIGAVHIEARYSGRQQLTNRYRVRVSKPPQVVDPGGGAKTAPNRSSNPGRKNAATPVLAAGSENPTRGSRMVTPTPAANLRQNPEFLTDKEPPPPDAFRSIATSCRIFDWDAFVAEVVARRRRCGQPTGRWAGPCLEAALKLAVGPRGWPPDVAGQALLLVAADPLSRSPMRVAEGGPWWDEASCDVIENPSPTDVVEAERRLADTDGLRVVLQAQARDQLRKAGIPLTRASVAQRALVLLEATARGRASGE